MFLKPGWSRGNKSVKWRSAWGAIRISYVALGSDCSWELSLGPLMEPLPLTGWTGTPPGQLPLCSRSLSEYSVGRPEPCLGWWRAQKIGFRLQSPVHEGLRTENKDRSLSGPAQVILSDVGHQQSRSSLLVSRLDLSDAIHNVPGSSSRCHREARCACMETAGS